MELRVGDRVAVNPLIQCVNYIQSRRSYTNMYIGKVGTVVCITDNSKAGVEFDEIVFTSFNVRQSSHDNGCHNRGKLHHSWYIPCECLDLLVSDNQELLLLL